MSGRSPHRPIALFTDASTATETSPDVPLVTQTQEESPDTVHQLPNTGTTPHQSNLQFDQLQYLCDVALSGQTPAFSPVPFKPSSSPKIDSPDVSRIKATTSRNLHETTKRTVTRDLNTSKKKKKKITYSPQATMLYFLRTKYVDSYATLHSQLANGYDTSISSRQAINNWQWKNKPITWGCFLKLQKTLMSSNHAITQDHSRLMLEDYMLCKPGEPLLCLISQKHHLFKDRYRLAWIATMKECMEIDPWKPIRFQSHVFFILRVTVNSNPHLNDFLKASKSRTMDEINQMCSKVGGAGLSLSLCNKSLKLIKFDDVLNHCETIQFWSTRQTQRISIVKKVMRDIKDTARLGPVLARYLDEVYGDRFLTSAYIDHYKLLMSEATSKEQLDSYKSEQISTERLRMHLNLNDKEPNFIAFRNHVDMVTKTKILEVYGNFSEFTTPILTQRDLSEFAELFKTSLPTYYTAISVFLNKHNQISDINDITIQSQWDRYILYVFCIIVRMRNNRNLVYWAICNAAAAYGQTEISQLSTYFGISVHNTTVKRHLENLVPYDKIMLLSAETLRQSGFFGVSVFDNAQDMICLKFQRNGESSSAIVVTARCFIKPNIPLTYNSLQPMHSKVEITYEDQSIPSTYGMPRYENCNQYLPTSYEALSCEDENDIDISGKRVEAYYKMSMTANIVSKLKRIIPRADHECFSFMQPEGVIAMQKMRIASKLSKNNRGTFGDAGRCFYTAMSLFQHNATKHWRGEVEKCSLIIPPISPEDETTSKGAAKVILSLLALYGILEATENEGTSGNAKCLKLADDYESRYLMVVGDGLSQVRARTFTELVQGVSNSFGPQHDASNMINKALNQIIHVPGDLHGGCFHFLSAVYSLFYGSLIQPIQILLGWKRIRGTDVTKCYQQAAGLALMISNELDRLLFNEFFKTVYENDDNECRNLLISIEDPQVLALKIAERYEVWINEKRSSTTDQCFQMVLNFVSMMDMYRVFRVSLRAGDAIMIEALYNKFLPLYLVTNKKHYVEIVLSNIETLYSKLSSKLLHLVRINRTTPLYSGNDRQGMPMANWALDAVIELQQKYYHKMQQGSNVVGWLRNSPHIMLMNKCKRFTQQEYSKVKNAVVRESKLIDHVDNDSNHDPAGNMKRTFVPNRAKEYKCISEFLFLSKMTIESPLRKYDSKVVWDVIVEDRVTTKLEDKNQKMQASMMLEEALTEEEKLCSSVTNDLFDYVESQTGSNTQKENEGEEVDFDPESMARDGVTVDEDDDDQDNREQEVVSIKVKKITVRKATINSLGFKDVFTVGKDMLEKKNLMVTRLRARERLKRKTALKQKIFDSVCTNVDGSDQLNETMKEGMRRLSL